MPIVEQPAVPLVMLSPGPPVEVLMIGAIELVQSIEDILRGVAVNNVQQDNEAQAVGSVDQLLEVLRRAIPAAGGEEVVDLVAKTCIIGMLHDGHELYDIIAQRLDPWEHVLGELLVCGNPELR